MKCPFILSLLFASCSIPHDKDACIEITAGSGLSWNSKDGVVQFKGTKAYDTVLSTLSCEILDKSLKPLDNLGVSLIDSKKRLHFKTNQKGLIEFGWIAEGKYELQVGKNNNHPYLTVHKLQIRSGQGAELKVILP